MTDRSPHPSTSPYNSRLQPTSYQIPNVLNKSYEYFADGALKHAGDLIDGRYDRAMQYDHAGRLAAAQTGTEARGGATEDGPFNQTFQYDAFDHTTARTSRQWTTTYTDFGSYQNERHNGWIYDADGNVLSNSDVQFTYNAEGLPAQTVNLLGGSINSNSFDGEGQRIKSAYQLNQSSSATTKYYLRATPLGGKIVADILSSGQKVQGYVYAGDSLLAVQKLPVTGDSSSYVTWRHEEPSGSVRGSDPSGGQNWATELHSAEQDATGVDMKAEDPGPSPLYQPADENNPDFPQKGNPTRLSGGCTFNGMPIADCGFLLKESAFNQFTLVEAAAKTSVKIIGTRTIAEHFSVRHNSGHDADDLENNILKVGSNSNSGYNTLTILPLYGSNSWGFSSYLSLAQQPVSTGFILGQTTSFSYQETVLLKQAYDRINQDDCKKFINGVLAENKVGKDLNELWKLLNKADISLYNEDSTDTQLGVSMDGLLYLRNAFNNDGAPAATVGSHVFLSDLAFRRATTSILPALGTHNRNIDTATIMVHELLHVAGLKDPQVQNLNREIHKHCGFTGMDY